MWRSRIKGEDVVATVHGDDITIGGQRSAVESLIKMISKKYEIKKQVLRGRPRPREERENTQPRH